MRYAADESPPHRLAFGLAAQKVALIVSGIVLTPVIVLRAGGVSGPAVTWSIFMALLVSGVTTVLQARPVWRLGAGYVLFMGTSGAFITVGVDAIKAGGLALLMTLICVSSFTEFAIAGRLSALRRLITPTVGGTTIMLIAVTVMPIAFGMLEDVPAERLAAAPRGALASAVVTFAVIVGLTAFGSRAWRLWSPLVGLIAGTAVAGWCGLVDMTPVHEAPWVGMPRLAWPGIDLSFSPAFWELLPAFIIVTLVGTVETYGDGIAIQKVSWHSPRPVDYRAVQGAIYADGVGNLLSGLGGTLPNTTYSTSISAVEMTGVAARRVGVYGGILLALLAFSPRLSAILLMVPNPVVGAYLIVLIVLLFMHGVAVVTEDGLTLDKSMVIGLSLWLGIGFQDKVIFQGHLPEWAVVLFGNGMTAGALVALGLTALLGLKSGRRRRLRVSLSMAALPDCIAFARKAAAEAGWSRTTRERLELAIEETLVLLVERGRRAGTATPSLALDIRAPGESLVCEFQGGTLDGNLGETPVAPSEAPETDLGFRILNAMVENLRHEQYHERDFIAWQMRPRLVEPASAAE